MTLHHLDACIRGQTEHLLPCDRACGHAACAVPSLERAPTPPLTWLQRWARQRRIARAANRLQHAEETHRTHIANRYSEAELERERRFIGALHVELAIAHR